MPEKSTALYRGRVSVRPWRVGVLVDLDDTVQVTRAITRLSGVWGGMYMPLLDVNADLESLRAAVRLFDVDSVYAEDASQELMEFLRKSHFGWRGAGRYGPFATDGGLPTGLLSASALEGAHEVRSALWTGPDEPSLALSAYRGARAEADERTGPRPVLETTRFLELSTNYGRRAPRGFAVLRDESARDASWFWNCRALSGALYPLSTSAGDFNSAVLAEITSLTEFAPKTPPGVASDATTQVPVWGFDDLEPLEQLRLEAWAEEKHVQLDAHPRDAALIGSWFPGFSRISSSKFRVEARPTDRLISIDIPRLQLHHTSDPYPGLIAAEINFHEASGVDPRLTVAIPPHRQHAALIDRPGYGADQTRMSSVGPVFGVQADLEDLSVLNAYQLDVMRLLFDDDKVVFGQSDEGKFQTRAAELFGGALAGHLAQPGVRAAIQESGTRNAGMTLSHLKHIVTSQRGEWPDPIRTLQQTPQQYAEHQVHLLLSSGMLVPHLQIQCHECRITLRLRPEQLGATVECEFCGADVRLALALALTRPEWRYRLAGHLSAKQVEAFLPAMAASAVLGSLHHVEGPPASHMFGLQVQLPSRRPVEVDVAMIMHEDGWVVILGEVKNHKPVDANDVENLFELCAFLSDKGIPAIPLFATFNEEFSSEEQGAMRSATDSLSRTASVRGRWLPLMPLLLTRQDMSLPAFHDDHPWRWSKPGDGSGVIGIALESTRRHLGLLDFTWPSGGKSRPQFEWQTDDARGAQ